MGNRLNQVPPPALPNPAGEYRSAWHDQFNRILRLFFAQVANGLNLLVGSLGGRYLEFPCGAFSSLTVQSVVAPETPTLLTFDTVDYANGVYHQPGDGVHFTASGLYNVQFSAQVTNTGTQDYNAAVWLRKNGVDLPDTTSVISVTGTHGGHPGYMVVAANFYVPLVEGDYLEFWWAASDTQVQLNYLPAITTPFARPGAPSFICTASFVSTV